MKQDPKPLTKHQQYWHNHVSGWKRSGLSQASYARKKGLKVNDFYRWHWRLKQRPLMKPVKVDVLEPSTDWVNVLPPVTTMKSSCRAKLPSGIEIEFEEGYPLDNALTMIQRLSR